MKMTNEILAKVGEFLTDHKCSDVKIFDVAEKSGWTDYIVLATASSLGHLRGVVRHAYGFLADNNMTPKARQKKIQQENWIFIDCGDIVFHVMDNNAREFYQLESLWFDSNEVYSS